MGSPTRWRPRTFATGSRPFSAAAPRSSTAAEPGSDQVRIATRFRRDLSLRERKEMKKLLTLFVMLLAALALAACGGGDSTSGDTSPAAGAVEDVEEGAEEAGEKAEEAGEEAEEKAGEAKDEAEGGTEGSSATFDVEADPSGQLAFTSDEASA